MHRALFIDEILYAIFRQRGPQLPSEYHSEQRLSGTDLVALARTCRVFKEPALDVLWRELNDSTALVRCLPDICCLKGSDPTYSVRHLLSIGVATHHTQTYVFERKLGEAERDIIKGYTRRIRGLRIFRPIPPIDSQSFADLCLPSSTDPLFPNLRRLHLDITDESFPLIRHVAVRELRWLSLRILASNVALCENTLDALGTNCPNLEEIIVFEFCPSFRIDRIVTGQIRYWRRLRALVCPQYSLSIDTLTHLSHVHGLTELAFTLSDAFTNPIAIPDHVLHFPALRMLQVSVESIAIIPQLFTSLLLPAVKYLTVLCYHSSPSEHAIRSLSAALAKSCSSSLDIHLSLMQIPSLNVVTQDAGRPVLTPEDVHPLLALNLASIIIDLNCIIDLNDSDLLGLASACPRLSSLAVNNTYGWAAPGITPTCLIQILQRCRLSDVCIALDTQHHTLLSPMQPDDRNSNSPLSITLDVADSAIQAESVPALAAYFADHFPVPDRDGDDVHFSLESWKTPVMRSRCRNWEVYAERWAEVYTLAKQTLLERSHNQ